MTVRGSIRHTTDGWWGETEVEWGGGKGREKKQSDGSDFS